MRAEVLARTWKRFRRRVLKSALKGFAGLLLRQPLWDGRDVPSPSGRYGSGAGAPLPFVLLGDSSAVTVGVLTAADTVGAQLARLLADRLDCPVDLDVTARAGATTAGMARQVRSVAGRGTPGVAFILIGGNDVLLPAPLGRAADRLGRYVRELRGAGWEVVIGSCADIGAAPALRRPAAVVASIRSKWLARHQRSAVAAAGGRVVPLATDAFRSAPGRLYCPDAFHPSAEGYRLYLGLAAPAVTEAGEAHLRAGASARRGQVALVQTCRPASQSTAARGHAQLPRPARRPTPRPLRHPTEVGAEVAPRPGAAGRDRR
ncbi:GDSL-type esterase/lipase family protein [Streptomyces sp. NPDC051109]|uniref:GDSL-type esterase/lipase family protein n=1 Tax=Streptomyces sp. NPDC051109 TaxID=3365642 RepID=UPI001064BC49